MPTPDIIAAMQDYGQCHAHSLETLLPPPAEEGTWCERLRSWLAACETAPWRALRRPELETAVTDLVALELSCQAFAATQEGLEVTDRGGTLWARRALAELLGIVARHDARTGRDLARLARRTREARLHRIRTLILARA